MDLFDLSANVYLDRSKVDAELRRLFALLEKAEETASSQDERMADKLYTKSPDGAHPAGKLNNTKEVSYGPYDEGSQKDYG